MPRRNQLHLSRRGLFVGAGALGGAALLGATRGGGLGTTSASIVPAPTTTPVGLPEAAPADTEDTTTTTAPGVPVDRLAAFRGYGAWWDAYNWSPSFTAANATPLTVTLADVGRLAAAGVQTLYLQTGHNRAEPDLLDEPLLVEIITAAHAQGMRVVAWYVPMHLDQERDLRRLEAPIRLGVDAVGADMEVDDEPDIGARNARLLWISEQFAARNPDVPFAAIVNPPVLYDEINLQWWPGFPYAELVPHYDLWMPMAYWTQRKGPWREAATYIRDSILRLRMHTAVADLPVHPIGGLADETSVEEVQAMGAVVRETGCLGGSLYDDPATNPALYEVLRSEFTR